MRPLASDMEIPTATPDHSLPSYQYTPLSTKRTCRLVRIKKRLRRVTKTVEVELVEAEIDKPLVYNALSYAVSNIVKCTPLCDLSLLRY